jgi:hypothetical protein
MAAIVAASGDARAVRRPGAAVRAYNARPGARTRALPPHRRPAMKRVHLLALLLLLPAFGGKVLDPDPSLDGLWFKVTVKAKGRAVLFDGTHFQKASASVAAFVHLVLDESAADGEATTTTYAYEVWTENEPDAWNIVGSADVDVVVTDKDQYILPDVTALLADGQTVLVVRSTLLIKLKHDKQGALKSAKLATLGGETTFGGTSAGFFYGDANFAGKTVDEADLPFTP